VAARDDAETIKWYEKGAERGNVFALFNLGMAYLKGIGVARDYVEAYKWLHLSATKGYDDAPAICEALEKKSQAKT
jgi:TPR repeat protein